MLSDEEKKAYDNLIMLKYFTMEKEDKQEIDTIFNIIEKQSKEIEKINYIKRSFDYCVEQENKKWEDKIKAKIEELEKGNKNTFIRGEKILVLQSLLEKE